MGNAKIRDFILTCMTYGTTLILWPEIHESLDNDSRFRWYLGHCRKGIGANFRRDDQLSSSKRVVYGEEPYFLSCLSFDD